MNTQDRVTENPAISSTHRVCIVGESFFPNLDGGAVFARSLAERLQRAGYEVCVITWRDLASYPRHETIAGVPITRVAPTRRWGMLGRYFSMLTVAAELLRRRRQYDIVLVSNLRILGLPGLMVARSLGRPCILRADSSGELSGEYVSNLHGHSLVKEMLGTVYFGLRNRFLRRADVFVSITTAIHAEFIRVGVPPERIRLISNGIDTDVFTPISDDQKAALRTRLGLPARETIVAYSGRLTREKGLQMLVRAWKAVHREHPGTHLLLIGSGKGMPLSCEDELRSFVLENGLAASVTFTGSVERVYEYLQCADVFVLPSRTEALPLALIEAMACELPAIATNVGGIPDVISDGVNGVMIGRDRQDELVEAVGRLVDSTRLRHRLGERGRETVVSKFSLDKVTVQYTDLLDSHLKKESSELTT